MYLSGHSLGAANATLTSYFLAIKYPNIQIKLITFGCPRVGNAQWKEEFESKDNIINYRITNKRDIVTVIPTINYCHVGEHIYLSDDGLCKIDNNKYSSLWYRSLLHSFSIYDHKMTNYVKNMLNKETLWNQLNDDEYSSDSES